MTEDSGRVKYRGDMPRYRSCADVAGDMPVEVALRHAEVIKVWGQMISRVIAEQ